MTTESTITTQCPHCRAKFHVEIDYIGRRTRCPRCKDPFEIRPSKDSPEPPEPPDPEPVTLVGVNCRLCGTRMYGHIDQVGQPMRCPDCNTETKLPPPKVEQGPMIPAAMLGDQYELYEEEEQPWGATLAAAQAEMVPVHCQVCDTLQYVAPVLVGTMVECPDCGHSTRVRPSQAKPRARAPRERELEVEPPSESVVHSTASVHTKLHDFERLSEADKEAAIARVATNRKARPQMTRFPLLSGWAAFLGSPGVVPRWIVLSAIMSCFAALAVFAFSMIFQGYGAIAGLFLLCGAAFIGGLWFANLSAAFVSIVTESSEGNNQVMAWPSVNPVDWMGETVFVVIAGLVAGAPGYVAVQLAGADLPLQLLAIAVSTWLFFPLMHLSTLEGSSPFALLMPGVAGSIREWFGTWVVFYFLSGMLLGATIASLLLLDWASDLGWLLGSVPIVGGLLAYARLVGRLAWRIRYEA
ncbi:MJ0042-type zinc finger domain-containing protein [Aeoliella sp. SH292]|uniref:MJ0042-type zinc finger domain-containing protein n=1 Tax=Aeoliella sp. SH292 TaxID=3454464 RepID=UPI003F98464B